jgi:hypothetical protein
MRAKTAFAIHSRSETVERHSHLITFIPLSLSVRRRTGVRIWDEIKRIRTMPPDKRTSEDEPVEIEKRLSLDAEFKKTPQSSIAVSPSEHLASTVALCMCTLTHSYQLISVYPYSGFMAIELLPFVNEENAGLFICGVLIASSFMVGRAARARIVNLGKVGGYLRPNDCFVYITGTIMHIHVAIWSCTNLRSGHCLSCPA